MKLFIISLCISFSAFAFETNDHILKLEKSGEKYVVSLATLSQIYHVKNDKPLLECLRQSIKKKHQVKLKLDPENAQVQSCESIEE